MRLVIPVALFLTVLRAVGSSDGGQCAGSTEAVPLCTVLASAEQYDGKEITVRGLYAMTFHGSILMGAACPRSDVNLRDRQDFKVDKQTLAALRSLTKKNPFQTVDEVLHGTFHVAKQEQCFGQICASYEIEVNRILCAQAVPQQ
jgi:hypothetical protein